MKHVLLQETLLIIDVLLQPLGVTEQDFRAHRII
jgi:hypothetical protein